MRLGAPFAERNERSFATGRDSSSAATRTPPHGDKYPRLNARESRRRQEMRGKMCGRKDRIYPLECEQLGDARSGGIEAQQPHPRLATSHHLTAKAKSSKSTTAVSVVVIRVTVKRRSSRGYSGRLIGSSSTRFSSSPRG